MCSTAPAEGFPWDDLRKIFGGCQWMAKVPNAVKNIVENFNRLSRAHERYRRQTDRQTTDRQTDGRAIAYSEREREFTFAKKKSNYT